MGNDTWHCLAPEICCENKPNFECRHIKINEMTLVSTLNATELRLRYRPESGMFLFCMPLLGRLRSKEHGEEYVCDAEQHCALLCGPEQSTLAIDAGSNTLLLMGSLGKVIGALAQRSGCDSLPRLTFHNPMSRAETGPAFFCSILDHIIDVFSRNPRVAASPVLTAQYEEMLLTAMLTCLPHSCSRLLESLPAPQSVPRVVRLAEEYIKANAEKPLRLRDLARETGMSVRSIQASFKRYRGYTPTEFLRRCRLRRARRMLLHPGPETTILSVAFACGFASQSNFCKCYRREFGERAMETLHNGP